MTRHRLDWKKDQAEQIKKLCNEYPVIAVADLTNFPASLFQSLRKQLAGKAVMRVSKTRIMKRALEESNLKLLSDVASESCALIFTQMNPFELFAVLKKNKGNTAAKAGMIAPNDIMIPAGDTGLPPGPALSELKGAGLKVKIAGATIEIIEDKVVVKEGGEITAAIAGTLSKLDIKPIKIGMELIGVHEAGEIFTKEVLDIDTDAMRMKFATAAANAFALTISVAYPTTENMPFLIRKAVSEAKAVALEGGIYTEETIPIFLARADKAAKSLKAKVPAEAPAAEAHKESAEEKKEEGTEDGKESAEEKKEAAEEKKEE